MTDIFIPLEKQLIIVPKSAFKEDGRNSTRELFVKAGYDKVNDEFDRRDQIEQGDFIFRGIKGSNALATQFDLFRGKSVGVLMGSDVLFDADFLAQDRYGVKTEIDLLLTLASGPCTLNFLAPRENPIRSRKNLEGRRIFTKYPNILKRMLEKMGINAQIRETEGADTRVNEFRDEDPNVAAFEIVGSGDTARKNRLQIVRNKRLYPTLNNFDAEQVQTDLFLTNFRAISEYTKEAIREFGLALEAAQPKERYALVAWNAIWNVNTDQFAKFGMQGPTVTQILSRDDRKWCAFSVAVPEEEANRVRMQVLQLGGQDVLVERGITAGISAETSQVIAMLGI